MRQPGNGMIRHHDTLTLPRPRAVLGTGGRGTKGKALGVPRHKVRPIDTYTTCGRADPAGNSNRQNLKETLPAKNTGKQA